MLEGPVAGKDWNESARWCRFRQCVEMSLDAAGRSACATSAFEGAVPSKIWKRAGHDGAWEGPRIMLESLKRQNL